MKISKRETILIIFVIFTITAAAYYFYYLVPTMDKIKETAIQIEQKQIKVISMQTSIEQIDSVKNEIAILQDEIAEQTQSIPKGISQPLQLVEITTILNGKCDSPVIAFDHEAHTYDNYQTNRGDLSFSTSYENLLLILDEFDKLEMTNQIVDINALYSEDPLTFYTAVLEGYYLSVGLSIDFYSFYADADAEPLEKQPFESSPVEYKNPFRPTLN